MNIRHTLLVILLAVFAASISIGAAYYDQLWLVVAGLAAAFVGGGTLLHLRSGEVVAEIAILREHLDTTREQAAILARLTRELRDSVENSTPVHEPGAARASDFAVLSALVRDLADAVSELDRRSERVDVELSALRGGGAAIAKPTGMAHSSSPMMQARPQPAAEREPPLHTEPQGGRGLRGLPDVPQANRVNEPSRAVRQLVAAAIAADRFDLYLQRIVGLPQRRVRGYDVTLRPDGSDLAIPNSEIRNAVEAVGHQLAFDRKLIIQTVRIARVFEQRERDVLLFADVSQRFLMSEAAFDDIMALVADAPLAPQRIVLCLPQRFFNKAVAFEHEALRKLSDLGFRFMMRDVEQFEFDLQRLSRIGVRWIRASASAFLHVAQTSDHIMDVAVADFVTLLDRRKISFVAEDAADEETVAELLDLSVPFAHGLVFAPPQAVRADVLEGPITDHEAPRADAMRPAARAPEQPGERRGLRDIARRA